MNALLAACGLVDVGDCRDFPILADNQFPRHRARNQREASGFLRRRNHDLTGAEVGGRDAPSSALRAVVTRCTPVVRLSQDRETRRNAQNIEMVARLLDDGFCAARLGRRQKDSIGRAGNIFLGPENSDVRLDLVVVRRDVFVTQRPVVAHTIVRTNFEVDRRHAQGDSSPVIGPSADDARAEPPKSGSRSGNVGFTFNLPRPIRSHKFVCQSSLRATADPCSAMRQVVRPDVLFIVSFRNNRRTGLEQRYAQTAFGQHFGRGAPRGARADDADVIGFGRSLDLHESPLER